MESDCCFFLSVLGVTLLGIKAAHTPVGKTFGGFGQVYDLSKSSDVPKLYLQENGSTLAPQGIDRLGNDGIDSTQSGKHGLIAMPSILCFPFLSFPFTSSDAKEITVLRPRRA